MKMNYKDQFSKYKNTKLKNINFFQFQKTYTKLIIFTFHKLKKAKSRVN